MKKRWMVVVAGIGAAFLVALGASQAPAMMGGSGGGGWGGMGQMMQPCINGGGPGTGVPANQQGPAPGYRSYGPGSMMNRGGGLWNRNGDPDPESRFRNGTTPGMGRGIPGAR